MYRSDVDGLRAVAVIPVVLFHAGIPGFSGGFIGVDIFFVISGWLITQILFREIEQSGEISIVNFYARRVRRILPSLAIVVFTTVIAGALLLSAALFEVYDLSKSAIATMAFVANFYFLQATSDYFAQSAMDFPLLHTWSLAIEEQYYLVWPLLIVAATNLSRQRFAARFSCLSLIMIITISSLVLCAALMSHWGVAAFFLPMTRAWELGAGSALALAVTSNKHVSKGPLAAALGFTLIIGGVVLIRENSGFPFPTALVPVSGAALVLWGNGQTPGGPTARLLSTAPFVSIGRVSYAWYLWHWPLLSFAHILTLGESGWAVRGILTVASLTLAYLTTSFIENPIRFGPRLHLSSAGTIGVGLTTAALVVITASAVYMAARTGYIESDPRIAAAFRDRPKRQQSCLVPGGRAGSDHFVSECLVQGDSPRIVLWGDSFADHWAPALERWGRLPVEQLTKAACPPILTLVPTDPEGPHNQPYAGCTHFNSLVEQRLTSLREDRKSFIVIGGNWAARATIKEGVTTQFFDYHAHTTQESLAFFERGLDITLDKLEALDLPVVVVLQTPMQMYRAPACVQRLGASRCVAPLPEQLHMVGPVDDAIRRSVKRHQNAILFDPIDVLCDGVSCPALLDGQIAYIDDIHISASTAQSDRVAKILQPLLDAINHPISTGSLR
jgi:peptidoglycan/LPS O-acetylase OafA/YrhL